jgi:luciferase family oxidoreductase group 1
MIGSLKYMVGGSVVPDILAARERASLAMNRLKSIRLSVLDLATIASGSTPTQALANTVELAQLTERLGYHRFWVAEHHNMPGVASAAPAVIIAQIAAHTSSIRVGSGGVMLPNHQPLVIAEQFGTLEAMHPGRIDLGLGRAPGTDQGTARALRRGLADETDGDFPQQLAELIAFFQGSFPDEHPFSRITAVPAQGNMPPIWLLGSSGFSAQLAGHLGLPFSFAHHFSAQSTLPALELYRSTFKPSAFLDAPYAIVAASVLVADTDERAQELAAPTALAFLRSRQGRPGPFPSPEEAAAHRFTDQERSALDSVLGSQIVGAPDSVRAEIEQLLADTEADELMVTTRVFDHADRLRSYELLAELRGQRGG